jgi:serine/threonine protein kinase
MTRSLTAPGHLVAGRYRLESQIGGGGMGAVWLARDERLGRLVAVKQVLSPPGASAEEADQQRQRALREGRIAARLSHPHAISVYDVAVEAGQPWLVMEYLPSRSLGEVLAEDGILRGDVVAQIGAQVADALAATHAAGIVHRDVKPANILIGEGGSVEGLVKITDFGISHAAGDVTLTRTGQITGTPAYLSPEVAQGYEMTAASDVFSLGATLYACLEGQPPFGTFDNALGMLHRVAGGEITPPKRSGGLTRPLLRMLAADPAERPSTTEVRDTLAALVAGHEGDTTTVLLARTNLRSAAAGRTPTQISAPTPVETPSVAEPVVPAVVPPVPPSTVTPRPATAPAPAAPAPRTSTPPPSADDTGRRRRVPALWLVVGLVALLVAGLITFLVIQGGTGSPTATGSGTSSATTPATAAGAATSGSSAGASNTGGATSSSPSATTTPAAAARGGSLTAGNIRTFLTSYHQLVISNPHQAYTETGPTLRASESEPNYVNYWGQFSRVRLTGIQATDGQRTATATVTFTYRNGRQLIEQHRFTLLQRGNSLVLDSDYKA